MARAGLGLLLVALTAAAAWLGWTLVVPEPDTPSPVAAERAEPVTAEPAMATAVPERPRFALPPRGHYAGVTDRPLFAPTRRPPVPEPEPVPEPAEVAAAADAPPPEPEPQPPPPLEIILKGIVVTDGGRLALAAPDGDTRPLALRKGDTYQGWTVTEIHAEAVILRAETTEALVTLAYKTAERGE